MEIPTSNSKLPLQNLPKDFVRSIWPNYLDLIQRAESKYRNTYEGHPAIAIEIAKGIKFQMVFDRGNSLNETTQYDSSHWDLFLIHNSVLLGSIIDIYLAKEPLLLQMVGNYPRIDKKERGKLVHVIIDNWLTYSHYHYNYLVYFKIMTYCIQVVLQKATEELVKVEDSNLSEWRSAISITHHHKNVKFVGICELVDKIETLLVHLFNNDKVLSKYKLVETKDAQRTTYTEASMDFIKYISIFRTQPGAFYWSTEKGLALTQRADAMDRANTQLYTHAGVDLTDDFKEAGYHSSESIIPTEDLLTYIVS